MADDDTTETTDAAVATVDDGADDAATDTPVAEAAAAEPAADEAPADETAAEEAAAEAAAEPEMTPAEIRKAREDVAEEETVEEEAGPKPGELQYEIMDEDALLEEEVAPAPKPRSPYDKPGKWYVVHTQSGYEKKVKQNLEARIQSMDMASRIFETVIPMEDVVEFKQGKKVVVQKKMFPGYLLVRCRLDDDSWYVVRNTPGVTGFVGQGTKPSPLPRKEVESFLQVKPEGEEVQKKTRPRFMYEAGETVRVKEGPFADFSGEVIEINEDQLKVKVLVNIFGRETPVELEFAQVAKL